MVISSFIRSIFYTHRDSIIFPALYNTQHRLLRETDTYQKVETRARHQSDCLETLTRHHIMSSTMPLPGFETNLTYHHHEALPLLRNSPPRFSGVLPSTIVLWYSYGLALLGVQAWSFQPYQNGEKLPVTHWWVGMHTSYFEAAKTDLCRKFTMQFFVPAGYRWSLQRKGVVRRVASSNNIFMNYRAAWMRDDLHANHDRRTAMTRRFRS